MKDSTRIRIKVPAHLYESVKAQLTLREGKQNFGMPGSTTVKEKKSTDGPKSKPMSGKTSGEGEVKEEMSIEERVMQLEKTLEELKKGMRSKEEVVEGEDEKKEEKTEEEVKETEEKDEE